MTPKQLKAARKRLGLSAAGMARALEMPGRWADRTIRKWESEGSDVPGPVAVAVRGLLSANGSRNAGRLTDGESIACVSGHCLSPVACQGFGYCRERHMLPADDPRHVDVPK